MGIGTTNPSQRLEVKDGSISITGNNPRFYINSDELIYSLGGGTSVSWGYGASSNWFYKGISIGNAYGTVPPSQGLLVAGNVGIGTTLPDTLLKLAGNDLRLRFRNTGSSNKEWDIHGTNNDLAFEETGVGTSLYLKAGGNVGI